MNGPSVEQLRQQFITEVARRTGVDPGVVAQWTNREGAYAANGTGGLNFLNLRPAAGDVGVAAQSPGGFDQFAALPAAIDSTVNRIKQPFLQQYLAPALGKGADAQWNAIATSGWDANHYGHAPLPAATGGAGPAPAAAAPASPNLDAARSSLASFLMSNLQQHGHSDPQMFAGELAQLKPLMTPPAAQTMAAPASTANAAGAATSSPLTSGNLSAIPDAIATRPGIQVDSAILPSVSRIVQAFGVKVNSGFRSVEHNAEVGGAPSSDHLHGDAVDFTGDPEAMQALYTWAQGKFPYVEPMSQAHDHVHISFLR